MRIPQKPNAEFFIPPITHELGEHWDQPDRKDIGISKGRAYMSEQTFEKLGNYSASIPTAVYEGKMWRRKDPIEHEEGIADQWYLVYWVALETDPTKCSLRFFEIVIE